MQSVHQAKGDLYTSGAECGAKTQRNYPEADDEAVTFSIIDIPDLTVLGLFGHAPVHGVDHEGVRSATKSKLGHGMDSHKFGDFTVSREMDLLLTQRFLFRL